MTISLCQYVISISFNVFIVCFFQCCQLLQSPSDVVIVGVSGQEIKKMIINTSGPNVTARARSLHQLLITEEGKHTKCADVHEKAWVCQKKWIS